MTTSRRMELLLALGGVDGDTALERLCLVARTRLGVSRAQVVVMTAGLIDGTGSGSPGDAGLAGIEADHGEGPGHLAFTSGEHVLVPVVGADLRWPMLGTSSAARGIAAAFAFPLRLGGVQLGVLLLSRDRPGDLDDDAFEDAFVIAELALHLVLASQGGAGDGDLDALLGSPFDVGWEIHQATGMVAAHLSVPVAEALVRLRGHAFATDRTLAEVANDVVARRLRMP